MTVAQLTPLELFFIVQSAVIFGTALTVVGALAVMRYSRAEEAGQRPKAFPDLFLVLLACALMIYGGWVAGIFS